MLRNLPIHWSWEGYDVFMIFFKEFKINTRTTIVVSFQLWSGNKVNKIFISFVVYCEKYYFIEFIILISIGSSFFWKLKFHSHYRLNLLIYTGFVEFKCTIHISCIGDSYGSLFKFFCSFCESFGITESLLKCVVRMCVKMNKWHSQEYMKNELDFKRYMELLWYFLLHL